MTNMFKAGKMVSNVVDATLANGIAAKPAIDGAIVVLGNLYADPDFLENYEYDVYEMTTPNEPTDEIAIVDYSGIQEDDISGNRYKIGDKLYGLVVPAGTPTRIRRLALHDKFWLGDGNFSAKPVVGEYATAKKGSNLHVPMASMPKNGYVVKILSEESLTAGMMSVGTKYLCEVIQLGWRNGKDLLTDNPNLQASYLLEELNEKHSVSDYLSSNTDAIMEAAGISKNDTSSAISTVLYDKLQGGEKITATMSDGAVMDFSGHFSDDSGQWKLQMDLRLPEKPTKDVFPKGSDYTAKGGTIKIVMDPAEATSYGQYGGCILVYSYALDVSGVTVYNGAKSYLVDIEGLKRPENKDNPFEQCLIIDPNRSDWTITTHEFKLPEEDAEGSVRIDGKSASWKDIRRFLS